MEMLRCSEMGGWEGGEHNGEEGKKIPDLVSPVLQEASSSFWVYLKGLLSV